jgi:hypothetical protein
VETLKNKLVKNGGRPTDIDQILWNIGQTLGLFPEESQGGHFYNFRKVFYTDNSLLRCLVKVFDALEEGGLLKADEESYGDYQWKDPEKVYFYRTNVEEIDFSTLGK